MKDLVKTKYSQFYKSIGFERSGLFKLIKETFNPKTVLYPGCSIHVTPSFYFHHVVYIDKSKQSTDFFKDKIGVSELINQNKTYKESSYWKFIPDDFQLDLGIKDESFDMVLSLFSGKTIIFCERFVKPGGLILTNNLFSDNESIKDRNDFKLIELIKCKNFNYSFECKDPIPKIIQSKLRPSIKGFDYIDNETYFIYQKTRICFAKA